MLSSTSYDEAFELLRREVEQRLDSIQDDINKAVQQADYGKAEAYLKQAQELTKLRDDLDALAGRFEHLIEHALTVGASERLPRGLKTPQKDYRVPILQALVELGGQGNLNRVLKRVRELMEDRFNEYDLAPLSDGETPRWRNAAQWARNALREEGFIRSDSPRGIWAISDKGRRWLEERKQ